MTNKFAQCLFALLIAIGLVFTASNATAQSATSAALAEQYPTQQAQ